MDLPGNVLQPGERLLWSGRPQRFALEAPDWLRVALGLLWLALAFGVPWLGGAGISIVPLVVGPLGLLVAWGGVAVRLRTRRRSAYAVTDRRIVVADRRSGAVIASERLSRLPAPSAKVGRDGLGDVTFGTGGPKAPNPASPRLLGVPDAERVRDLIAAAQTAA
ncbi:PH domain-containing protein [Amycolatopsis kentuckyensis]|uniref:PH domain-containing protein n=1 Tax=Amycolatopsis kentuckyensis TaxID=218823 RepID=UPI0035692266